MMTPEELPQHDAECRKLGCPVGSQGHRQHPFSQKKVDDALERARKDGGLGIRFAWMGWWKNGRSAEMRAVMATLKAEGLWLPGDHPIVERAKGAYGDEARANEAMAEQWARERSGAA